MRYQPCGLDRRTLAEHNKLASWPRDREAVRFGHLEHVVIGRSWWRRRAHRHSPSNRRAAVRVSAHRVLGVAVAEIVLDQAEIVAAVGKREAA